MPKKKKNTKTPDQGALRIAAAVLVLLVAAGAGILGWQYKNDLRVAQIDVDGYRQASRAALVELARVDSGAALYDLDPALIADRVQRHPWVRAAEATRLPTGTLSIRVTERTPVALALGEDGRVSHYLDATGHQMPLPDSAAALARVARDVPLVRGALPDYHPVRPVEDEAVLALLDELRRADYALASEFEVEPSGSIALYTTPTDARGSVRVELGREDFRARLALLETFWQQAVLTQPQTRFQRIDLRFNGQVITNEINPDSSSQDSSATAAS